MIGTHYTLHAILENLLNISRAAYLGFLKAARQIEGAHPLIGFELRAKAEVRRHHGRDLHDRLTALGDDAETNELVSETLQRAWIDGDIVLGTQNTDALISVCILGEEDAFRAYSQSLEPRLDPTTEWLLLRQRDQVEACIRDLYAHLIPRSPLWESGNATPRERRHGH